jgi:hypothetical protein
LMGRQRRAKVDHAREGVTAETFDLHTVAP